MDGSKIPGRLRQRNRPISPNGRRGQPPDAADRFLTRCCRDCDFRQISSCCVPQPDCRTVAAESASASWIAARDAGSKRHGFSFHGAASHAPCRHASGRCVAWPVRAPRTRARRRSQQQPAATPSPSPSGQKGGAGRGSAAAHAARRRSSIACRRIPPPSRRWRCPAARSTSPPPRARSGCSTTRASRRPISPIPPTSSTAPIAQAGR